MIKKGVSWVLGTIILFLIALSGGFIVRFSTGQLINEEIKKTLGIRLLLHSFSLMYNGFRGFPQGEAFVDLTAPETECSFKCLDCYEQSTIFGTTITCDCDNYEQRFYDSGFCCNGLHYEDALIDNCSPIIDCGTPCGDPSKPIGEPMNVLGVEPNKFGLVCDDFWVRDIQPVMLGRNIEPAGLGFKALLTAHPESSSWSDYEDGVVTVYTQVPIDLYDYLMIRLILLNNQDVRVVDFDGKIFSLTKISEWPYETLTSGTLLAQGLDGLINRIFYHCTNVTITDEVGFCLTSGVGEELMGVRCADKVNYRLIIPPGHKLVKESDELICEYECLSQNTLTSDCDGDWIMVSCFNLNDFSKDCDSCSCDEFNYELNLCRVDECVGNTSPNFNELAYFDLFTGNEISASEEVIEFPSINEGGSFSQSWPLSVDCKLTVNYVNDELTLIVGDSDLQQNDLVNSDCNTHLEEVFEVNSAQEQTITIADNPRRSPSEIKLTDDLIEREYEVIANAFTSSISGDEVTNVFVRLLPFEQDPLSLEIRALNDEDEFLNDVTYNLFIDTDLINREVIVEVSALE